MAAMIGRTKGWVLWALGFACALVFGRGVLAGEGIGEVKAKYGIPARPVASEEDRKQADGLVEEYLKPAEAAEPSAAEREKIAALIKDLGAKDFTARDAASKELVRLGTKALGQLREAARSSDAEVAQRASAAIAAIEAEGKAGPTEKLKKLQGAARVVIAEKRTAANAALQAAAKAEQEATKSGDADGQKKAAAEQAAARVRLTALTQLSARIGLLVPVAAYGVPQVRYGVRAPVE